jgi:hypothetical protein
LNFNLVDLGSPIKGHLSDLVSLVFRVSLVYLVDLVCWVKLVNKLSSEEGARREAQEDNKSSQSVWRKAKKA